MHEKMEIQQNKETQAVRFGLIINNLPILLLFLFFSCKEVKKEVGNSYPTIEVLFNDDTIYLNREFEVKVYLTDTSLYYFYDSRRKERIRIHPHFKINDSLIYNKSDTLIHTFILSEVPVNSYLPGFYEWTCSVVVPHPKEFEGDIEFKLRFDNFVSPISKTASEPKQEE